MADDPSAAPAEGSPDRHRALLADMRDALLSELGARAVYSRLVARIQDEELRRVLARLAEDEVEQIERLRALMRRLGARPRKRSLRRIAAARALVSFRRLFGVRFALRVCLDAEWTVSRWYAKYADYLRRVGHMDDAAVCDELALTKRRHAQVLQAWVELLPRG